MSKTQNQMICPYCGKATEWQTYCPDCKKYFSPASVSAYGNSRGDSVSSTEQSVRTLGVEQSKQLMNSKITIGIIILVIGVALTIISPSLRFVETVEYSRSGAPTLIMQDTDLRDAAKFCGVALLIIGGIISAVGFSRFITTQPTTPPTPTTQPIVTQSTSPKSVELGNTPDEVQSVMGRPDKIINLGAQVLHVYKDMKIIYLDGKVSDVQLS